MLAHPGWLGAAVVAALLQTPGAPFAFDLPEDYEEFRRVAPGVQRWAATGHGGKAQFLVEHVLLTVPGASAEAVARDRREREWQPSLRGVEHQVQPWSGRWAGHDAAGNDVRYTYQNEEGVILERMVILHDHLVRVLWEGRAPAEEAARAALPSFRIPEAWMPDPPPRADPRRGLGEHGGERVFPGTLAVEVDLTGLTEEEVLRVTVRWSEGDAQTTWNLPPGATRLDPPEAGGDADGSMIRYRLPLDEVHGHGGAWGLMRTAEDLAALDGGWLAVPRRFVGTDHGYLPPAWTLAARFPPHLRLASAGGVHNRYDADRGWSTATVPRVAPGRAWPFFVAARYEPRQTGGRTWYLRKDAQAQTADPAPRALHRLIEERDAWLPAPRSGPVTTFPGAGDRALPGLYVLDEQLGWLRGPVDAQREGLTRRTWLARLAAQALFGAHVRGRGSGAPFLEAALAEYVAWRLLQRLWPEDAGALLAWWREREEALGALPLPLSLTPSGDLFGARRMLSRGGLVWRAIEERAGREALDAVLADRARRGEPWTTETLRAALQERTGEDWDAFFRDHVYGLQAP